MRRLRDEIKEAWRNINAKWVRNAEEEFAVKSIWMIVAILAGCSPLTTVETVTLRDGTRLDYVFWRTDSKGGVEAVGRDVYAGRGRLVDSRSSGGGTLVRALIDGTVAGPLTGIGAAAVMRPDRESISVQNSQGQSQKQTQKQSQMGKPKKPHKY